LISDLSDDVMWGLEIPPIGLLPRKGRWAEGGVRDHFFLIAVD
jgi:hypothetical protein